MSLPRWMRAEWVVSVYVRHEPEDRIKQVFNRFFETEDEARTFEAEELDVDRYEPYVELVTTVHRRTLVTLNQEVR